jgi:DNA-binding transcriptional LysR family regulator
MADDELAAIELRHLRYFLAVYEELHFGRAAAGLHMAQPPLSHAIRKLEDALGVRLFHRTSRAVAPTESGRAFAAGAAKVLANLSLAVAEARIAGGAGAAIKIGCTPLLPIEKPVRFLRALEARVPDVPIHLTHYHSSEQLRRLRAGELDFGVFDLADDCNDFETEPLFAGERLVALLPPDHRLAGNTVIAGDDLEDQVLATFPRAINFALHDWLLALLEAAGYRFAGMHEAGGADPRDLVLAVASGLGIAIVPSSLGEIAGAGAIVTQRPLDRALAMPDIVVAWPANPHRQLPEVLAGIRGIAAELREATAREPVVSS